MLNFISKLNTTIKHRVAQSGMPFFIFGVFGIINYPLSFVYWAYVNVQDYESLFLRLIATALCLGLILKKYWPKKLLNYFPLYWYFVVLFSIPYFGTYVSLQNHLSNAWIMNMLLGLFLFVLLVDWISFVSLLLIGTILAIITFVLTGGALQDIPQAAWINAGYMYTFALVIGGIFSRKSYLIKNLLMREENLRRKLAEKRATYNKQAAGSIAHDLRTPLASITNFTSILKDELPEVFTGYKRARDDKLIEGRGLSDRDFSIYQESIESIQQAVDYSNHYINMILGNLKHDTIKTDSYEVFAILPVVEKAIKDYPYSSKDKSLLKLNPKHDFEIWGDKFYITNVINNLLKNAFYYIKDAGKGEIDIWLECKDKTNELHVKDTAKGAPKTVCNKMFEPYYSAREGGTGLGLAFCKSIMQSFKGDIKADSKEGEYMHFVLSFPHSKFE